jgi:hypothetical protein
MLKMGNDSIFFETGGYEPETAFTQTYLASLRQHASTWETDVRAEDTHSETIPDQVVVGIPVYGISGLGNHLWLRCAENRGGTPALEGSWVTPSRQRKSTHSSIKLLGSICRTEAGSSQCEAQ